jgi:hypothetical protein
MDNDTKMLAAMGNALVDLQVKYRNSSLADRMAIKPSLDELVSDYAEFQLRLLKEGVVSTDEELKEMQQIKVDIDKAANTQKLLVALARTIAFVATKV